MDYAGFIHKKLKELKAEGNYRYFLEVRKSARQFPRFYYTGHDGSSQLAVNWCSNDYLALSTREELIRCIAETAALSGSGSGGTRNISGTTQYHHSLEKILADWHGKKSALLFNGAYQANVSTLQTLGRQVPGLIFFSDERNHASIIEGIRGCRNEKKIFRHNDSGHLEELLRSVPLEAPKLIVFESVYSMNGTIAPVKELLRLAKQYNALSYVDEVHAVGLYGPTGAGILEQENLQQEIDILNGTLSKAIGVFGGYIAASAAMTDFIRSFGSGFIFTTSLPPAICAAAAASITLIQQDNALRKHFFQNVQLLRKALEQEGIPFAANPSHITIIPASDSHRCRQWASRLLKEEGIYLQPINYPTVPPGEECLRVIITAAHSTRQIVDLASSLKKILYVNHQNHRQEFSPVLAAG